MPFSRPGCRIFGPTKAAAELEASKVFCKHLLRHADVPTADYRAFRDADSALHLSHASAKMCPWWSRPTGWRPARG